jgi:hypothetical protein
MFNIHAVRLCLEIGALELCVRFEQMNWNLANAGRDDAALRPTADVGRAHSFIVVSRLQNQANRNNKFSLMLQVRIGKCASTGSSENFFGQSSTQVFDRSL